VTRRKAHLVRENFDRETGIELGVHHFERAALGHGG